MLPIALSSQLFQLFLFVVGMDTNTWKQVGMERTTTNSLVPFQPFQLGRMKLRHGLNTTYEQYTSQGAPTYPYFSKPLKYVYFSSTSPLLAHVYTRKTLQRFSDLQDCLIWTWKYISQLPGEKGYAYHPERTLDDTFILFTVSPHWTQILSTIHSFTTLAANNKPRTIRSKK